MLRALGVVCGSEVEGNYLGQDYAGIIRKVGFEVKHVQPGNRVIVWSPFAISTRF